MITLNRICPICGSNKGIELDRICMLSENENILPDEYQIVECEKCGFTYSSMDACQSDFDNYYKKLNIYSEAEDLRAQISDEDNNYFNKIFSLIKPYVSQSSNIIDIGCGGGQLLDYLSRKGLANLYGLDPSAASVESLCERGINGIEGSVFDDVHSSLIHHFDLVISTMVLEPLTFHKSCTKAILAPCGAGILAFQENHKLMHTFAAFPKSIDDLLCFDFLLCFL